MFSNVTAIPTPVQAVLELFEGPLSEVRFGDIDGAALRRLASEVEASAAELDAHQAALEALRKATTERLDQLLGQTQRALAYARIYAEGDEALTAQLAQINLSRPAKRQKGDAVTDSEVTPKSGARTARSRQAAPADAPAQAASDPEAGASSGSDMSLVSSSASVEADAATAPGRKGKRRDGVRASLDDTAVET